MPLIFPHFPHDRQSEIRTASDGDMDEGRVQELQPGADGMVSVIFTRWNGAAALPMQGA
jgi:hypothetical protein